MKTVTQAFDALRQNLELTDKQRDAASAQHTRVRERLRSMPGYHTDFLTGSYKRRTAIRPLKDIDFFVVLALAKSHWDDRPTDRPTTVLERLHHAMDRAWPTKGKPKRQTRSINIDFSSTEIGFDAVPAVERAGGGYWIPDRDQDAWIATNPKQHEAVLIAANEKAGGRLNPMIKMVKRWRRELKLRGIDAPFSSFHLEALACQRYTGWYAAQPPASLPAGVADLFDYLARKMQDTCPDPGGVGPALDAGMTSTQRRQAIGLLAQAASTAREALRLDAQGHTSSAHQQWVTLFGNDYHYRT
ncbi:MAG: CBASS oligonucleotide cyclase [bacterium]